MKTAVFAIILFAIIIFPHELGHFIAARIFGVRVLEFSFGFGPTLFSWERKETKYMIKLFPIGGFCQMDGEILEEPSDADLIDPNYKRKDPNDPALFNNKKPWQRLIILAAGAFMNLLIAFLIMTLIFVFMSDLNIFQCISFGFQSLGELVSVMWESIVMIFTGQAGIDDITGPVGMVEMVGETIELGFWYYCFLVAMISVNLALINMLPLPALDGGRIIFIFIEWITGKPVNQRTEGMIHTIGILLLLSLMIFVAFNDVGRIFFK